MIFGFFVLLCCQLVGEALARAFDLSVPGPVIGLVLLFLLLELATASGRMTRDGAGRSRVGVVATTLLANLGLLFVPAGAGVIQNLDVLGAHAVALAVTLIVSTVLTMITTVVVFRVISTRLTGR